MLRSRVILACVLLSVSALAASAQRGGGRSMRGRGRSGGGIPGGFAGEPSPTLKASDLARLNPVTMVLAQAKAFAFTDSQVARLQEIRDSLAVKNAPQMVALDSVLAAIRQHGTDTSGTEGDRLMRAGNDRVRFTEALGVIRDNDDAAAQQAMALVSGTQATRVYDVILEQRAMMAAVLVGGDVPSLDAPNSGI